MTEGVLLGLGVALLWLVARGRLGVGASGTSNDHLLREYTLHLHRRGRPMWLGRLLPSGIEGSDSTAARELERRGIDPDKAIDELFDARRERRPMDWNACRLGPEGSSRKWRPR